MIHPWRRLSNNLGGATAWKDALRIGLTIAVIAILIPSGNAFAAVENTAHDIGIGSGGACSSCHIPHGATGERLWPADMSAQMVTHGTVGALCYYCHGAGGGATLPAALQPFVMENPGDAELTHGRDAAQIPGGDTVDATLPYGGNAVFECTTCHDLHSNSNKPFLQDDIDVLCSRCHQGRQFVNGTEQSVQGIWGANYGTGNPGSHPIGTDVFGDSDAPADTPIDITTPGVFNIAYDDGVNPGTHNLGGHLIDGGTTPQSGNGITCVTCHSVHGIHDDAAAAGVGTAPVENLLTIPQPTAGGAYLGSVYNGNGDPRNALCEGCHYTTAAQTIDTSTGSAYGGSEKPNPGVEEYTHPVDDLGAQADTGVSAFPANWPAGNTPGTNVDPGPICESCHTPHPNANSARATILDGSGNPILRAVSANLCAECHAGGAGRHHPAGVPMGTLSDPAVENGDGTLNCDDCHGGAQQSAHNWTGPGSFRLDPDWEPNSTGGVLYSDNGQTDEGNNPNKRFVAGSSTECVDCHLSAGPNPAPYTHHVTGGETEYGEYQDTGAASHYLGDTNAAALDYANGNCPDGTPFNATTDDWPGGGWSRFNDDGVNQVVCESCHELQSAKNVAGTALLLHRYVEGDSDAGQGEYASELCEGCHGVNPGGKSHPLTGDIVDSTGLVLDSTSNDPPAANPPTGNATYPAGTTADSMNCDSCHQPHDADVNGGTYILEDNITGTASGDTRGGTIADLNYMTFCKDCHTNY
jgi:predicted CXXCH cytochrome family protein